MAGYYSLTADAGRTVAVCTYTGYRTWCFGADADAVRWCGHGMDTTDTVFDVCNEFIHSGNYENMFRTVNQAGSPVSDTVYINQFTVCCDGVCAHQKVVGSDNFAVESS